MSNMKKVAIGAAIGAGAAVAGFLGGSVMAAANFEQSMDGVSAALGGVGGDAGITEAQFAALSDEALRIGSTTSVGATDAARAMELLGKAGVSVEEIYGGVAQGVVNLSEATGESLDQSASTFGTMQNMFRDTGISAEQMADTMVNAMNASDMSLSEMQTGIARLAPVISGTGMSFQESAGAIAYFNSLGFSAAEVGTSLTAAFTSMSAPTTAQAEAMTALGISAFDLKGEFIGFPAIMDQVAAATAGMTEAQRAETIAALFGADARDLMTEATKEGGDPLREYIDLMEESGTAATASATRLDNLKGDVEQLRGAIETLMIRVGSAMLPGLRGITQTLTGVIEGIMGFSDSVSQLMDNGLSPLEAVLGAVQIALLNAGFEDAANLVGALIPRIVNLKEAFDDLVDAGQALIAGDFSRAFDELGEASWELRDALEGASDALFNGLQAAFEAIPWGTLWDTAVSAFQGIVSAAPIVLDMVLDAAIALGGKLLGWANNGIDWVLEQFGIGGPSKTGQKEITVGSFLLDAIINLGGKLLQWANNGIDWVLEQFGIGGPTKTGQKELTVGSFLLDAAIDLGGTLKELASDAYGFVKSKIPLVASAALNVGTFLVDAALDLGKALKELATDAYGWVKKKVPILASALLEIGTLLIDAVLDVGGTLLSFVVDPAQYIYDNFIKSGNFILPVFLMKLTGITLVDLVTHVATATKSLITAVTESISGIDWVSTLQGSLTGSRGIGQAIGTLIRESVVGVVTFLVDIDWSDVATTLLLGLPKAIAAVALAPVAITTAIIAHIAAAAIGVVEGLSGREVDFSGVASAIGNSITTAISELADLALQVKDAILLILGFVVIAPGELLSLGLSVGLALWEDIRTGVSGLASTFGSTIKNAITDGIDSITASVGDFASMAANMGEAVFLEIADWIGLAGGDAVDDLKFEIVNAIKGISAAVGDFASMAASIGTAMLGDLKAWVQSHITPSVIQDWIMSQLPGKGKSMSGDKEGGLPDKAGAVAGGNQYQAMINAANAAATAVHAAFINMQIKVAATITNTATSAGAAFAGVTQALTNQANMARTAVHAAFVNMQIQVAQTATNTVTSAASAFTPITARLQAIATATVTAIQSTFAPLPSQTSQIGAQSTQSFISAFTPIQAQATQVAQSTRQSVTSTLQSIVGPAGSSGSAAGNAFVSGFRSISAAAGVASSAVSSIRGILASASSGAFGYGAAVGNQFAAGIRSSLGAVAAAAAALRALMPSSPAKRGPLSKPISFEYVNDALAAAMGGMVRTARRGMYDTQQELNRNASLAYSSRYGSGGGPNVTIITLEPGRWAEYLRKADRGNTAYSQISSRSRELSLGLRGA
jgi:TP901 family phage tail tape measure protein